MRTPPHASGDAVRRFEERFAAWLGEATARRPVDIVDRGASFHPDEAATIERAIAEGLVVPLGAGSLHMPAFRAPKTYQLFEYWSDRRGRHLSLWRELIIQVGVAAEIVLDEAVAARRVALEDPPFDVTVFRDAPGGGPLVDVEAKDQASGSDGVEAMLVTMRRCGEARLVPDPGLGTARVGGRLATNAEKKYFGLLRRRPDRFLAVAPGLRAAFDVDYSGGAATLTTHDGPLLAPVRGRDR